MHPVFSQGGKHIAWLSGAYVYNTNGHPIGYTSQKTIYSFKSKYIGQLEPGTDDYTWRKE